MLTLLRRYRNAFAHSQKVDLVNLEFLTDSIGSPRLGLWKPILTKRADALGSTSLVVGGYHSQRSCAVGVSDLNQLASR